MMEQLLEMAKKVSEGAEVYAIEEAGDSVSFENGRLKEIETKSQSGLTLRIIKNGTLGFAYTKNLIHPGELLRNALDSLKGKVEISFDFSLPGRLPVLDTHDPSVEYLSNKTLVEECKRICDFLVPKTDGQVNVSAGRKVSRIRILNSHGTDASAAFSAYGLYTSILFPSSYASIHRPWIKKSFERVPDSHLDFILNTYVHSRKEVQIQGGKMKVLFLPETLYTLLWRIQSVTNGKNIYQKISPVMDRLGEKILDEKLTVSDDPLNDEVPGARAFDDEGVPCQYFPVIEKGVLKHFYYDLYYAGKFGISSTGHGFKGGMWGGETISFKPSPSLDHLRIKPGEKS